MMRTLLSRFPWLLFSVMPLYAQIDARMLREPDVSATEIAFVYAGDIWVVPKSGGLAHRLSSPKGGGIVPAFLTRRFHDRLQRQL